MAKSIFVFSGNIGQTPKLTFQPANERSQGQPRPLLTFTVKYDRLVKSLDPNKRFEDKGGFWVRVDYWKNNAEQLNRLLAKGMQVQVSGELRLDEWPDSDNPGQNLSGMALTAESIAILPARVQTITMQERQAQQHMSPISAYQEMDQYDDDVPM
ncbi:single-stranded DNA-binding protein [Photobacterium leiognathi]|uniref:single-stranded DNA-binding protein n=2 Tax=Photobacterium leiognathi TaxID=553611 RepID=UPI0027386488|nr:single-stranded DNA-binding protein [Photobacterium leiognathi]